MTYRTAHALNHRKTPEQFAGKIFMVHPTLDTKTSTPKKMDSLMAAK